MFGFTFGDDPATLTDEEIVMRIQSQPWLCSVLLDRYQTPFLRRAERIIRDQKDAEEIVQDTFTKIYLNAHRFVPQPGATFSSWAYRILLNTSYTYYVRRRKNGERFTALDPEFEHMVADRASDPDTAVTRDSVERVLARLPGHLAAVLRLHYLERFSHAAIAAETGEDVGTIKARIHRAKAAFRKALRPGEITHLP